MTKKSLANWDRYKLARCRCRLCRTFHADIVDKERRPNQHGWIAQLCDSCLEVKIGSQQYQIYRRWKQAIIDRLAASKPALPTTE